MVRFMFWFRVRRRIRFRDDASPYNERRLVDVVQVQGQDVVLAAHVHAVVVFIHAQNPVV